MTDRGTLDTACVSKQPFLFCLRRLASTACGGVPLRSSQVYKGAGWRMEAPQV